MKPLTRRALLAAAAAGPPAARAEPDPLAWLAELGDAGRGLLGARPDPAAVRAQSVARLVRLFDGFLQRPHDYLRRVLDECGDNPEARLHALMLPALAYAGLSLSGGMDRAAALARLRALVDVSLPVVAAFVQAPDRDLLRLVSYGRHAAFLATLNLVLATHERLGGGARYLRLHDHLSGLLLAALEAARGGPLDSFPTHTWRFDTLTALLSVQLREEARGRAGAAARLDAHLAWRRASATDARTGLPRATRDGPPRGGDIAMQVCLLAQLRPAEARLLYDRFTAAHWKDTPVLAGFTEWPRGTPAVEAGLDAGPVLAEIGATASAVGLGAATAMGDAARRDRLLAQIESAQPLLRAVAAGRAGGPALGGLRLDDRYLSGSLHGDAVLLYALTWTRLPPAAPAPAR